MAKISIFPIMIILPLLGILFAGRSLEPYLEFPPLTQYVAHAGFSWPVFIGLAILVMFALIPLVVQCFSARVNMYVRSSIHTVSFIRFPWWGWVGLALSAGAWILAWTQYSWFAPFQMFVFTPIWLGYIISINALTYCRTGSCMLRDRPGWMLVLFVTSAMFWWFFEYLNRFVQNWRYVGIENLTPFQYFMFATFPFSTVLPAVLGTYELLQTMSRAGTEYDDHTAMDFPYYSKVKAFLVLLIFCAGLTCIGIWPNYLFPVLWIAPLFIISAWQVIFGEKTIFSNFSSGNWRRICLLAMSALICGFFWEMWNYYSLAKWYYTVPYVNRFRIFEMPILGYAGYLPFGLECAVIAEFINPGSVREKGCIEEYSKYSMFNSFHILS